MVNTVTPLFNYNMVTYTILTITKATTNKSDIAWLLGLAAVS